MSGMPDICDKLSQELKYKLKPNVNDTRMHCPEASAPLGSTNQN